MRFEMTLEKGAEEGLGQRRMKNRRELGYKRILEKKNGKRKDEDVLTVLPGSL